VTDLLQQALIEAALRVRDILIDIIVFMPRLMFGALIFAIALFVAGRFERWGADFAQRRALPASVRALIANTIRVVGITLAVILSLIALGADVYGLVAGLGIGGLVIGFALKDIIENSIAGALLLILRPFDLGDLIEVDSAQGHVAEINLRATCIRTPDNLEVLIPNAAVYNRVLKNFSAHPMRRREVTLRFEYETDLRYAVSGLLEAVRAVEGVASEPEPYVELKDFEDDGIGGTLFYMIDTTRYHFGAVHTEVLMTIQETSKRLKIEPRYPTTQVILSRETP
jgi:small conductance mechanosensitive channel